MKNATIFLMMILLGFTAGELIIGSLVRKVDEILLANKSNIILSQDFSLWIHIFSILIALLFMCAASVIHDKIKDE